MRRILSTLSLSFLLLYGCGSPKQQDGEWREEWKARQVVKASEADILAQAKKYGDRLFLQQVGADTLPVPVTSKIVRDVEGLKGKKKVVWEAYQHAFEENVDPQPNYQLLEDSVLCSYAYQPDSILFITIPKKPLIIDLAE